jgi:hypothetical protein
MSRRQRIEELEAVLRSRGAEFMNDDGCDEQLTESFLEHVLRFETADYKTVREWLAESGYVPPPDVPDDRISSEVCTLLDRLAFLGIVVESGDHLSDRELYDWITRENLDAHLALLDETIIHFDVIGSGSDEDNRTYLTYYASEEERARWKADFPDEELPARKAPPHTRPGPDAVRRMEFARDSVRTF